MAQIINAIYEEGVLKPLEPLDVNYPRLKSRASRKESSR
jgi:hypothetical protein